MIRRLSARLALLGRRVSEELDEMGRALTRTAYAPARALAWLWNGLKGLPGVHQVGHGIATVLGLYRLDRWLTERDRRKLRELVPLLESAGMHDTARKILDETEKPQDA